MPSYQKTPTLKQAETKEQRADKKKRVKQKSPIYERESSPQYDEAPNQRYPADGRRAKQKPNQQESPGYEREQMEQPSNKQVAKQQTLDKRRQHRGYDEEQNVHEDDKVRSKKAIASSKNQNDLTVPRKYQQSRNMEQQPQASSSEIAQYREDTYEEGGSNSQGLSQRYRQMESHESRASPMRQNSNSNEQVEAADRSVRQGPLSQSTNKKMKSSRNANTVGKEDYKNQEEPTDRTHRKATYKKEQSQRDRQNTMNTEAPPDSQTRYIDQRELRNKSLSPTEEKSPARESRKQPFSEIQRPQSESSSRSSSQQQVSPRDARNRQSPVLSEKHQPRSPTQQSPSPRSPSLRKNDKSQHQQNIEQMASSFNPSLPAHEGGRTSPVDDDVESYSQQQSEEEEEKVYKQGRFSNQRSKPSEAGGIQYGRQRGKQRPEQESSSASEYSAEDDIDDVDLDQQIQSDPSLQPITGPNLQKLDQQNKQNQLHDFEGRIRPRAMQPIEVGTPPTSKFTGENASTSKAQGLNPNNLPANLNLGFGDSASQRPNELTEDGGIPSITDLKNRPFASNLENAKILAQITKMRIDKLGINPRKGGLGQLDNENHQKEYDKQNKINRYLTGTLKHLNMTIDILIDQYDPVKIKQLKLNNEKLVLQAEKDLQQKQEQQQIAYKLDEIKNAEKQLKNTQKEMASLKKKYDKVKDWKYLADLYKQCDADKRAIQNLERDNKALKTAQQKAEYRLAKKLNLHGGNLFGDGITHTELVDLDNEMKVLRHKADYMQEKLYKEQQVEKDHERELDKLREKMKQAHVYEQKIIEKAKRMYKIDFEDAAKQQQQLLQEQLNDHKDKLLKKMVIVEDSKASIDKQYATQHRANQKKLQQLMQVKKQMEMQMQAQEEANQEKQRQLRFYKEQKQARDTIMKRKPGMHGESIRTFEQQLGHYGGSQLSPLPSRAYEESMTEEEAIELGGALVNPSARHLAQPGLAADSVTQPYGVESADARNVRSGLSLAPLQLHPYQMQQVIQPRHLHSGPATVHGQDVRQSRLPAPANPRPVIDGRDHGASQPGQKQSYQKSMAAKQQPEKLSGQNLNKLEPRHDNSLVRGDNIAVIRETLAELDDEDGMTKIDLETYQFNQGQAPSPGAGDEPPAKRASQLSLASQVEPSQHNNTSQGQFSAYKLPEDDGVVEQHDQKQQHEPQAQGKVDAKAVAHNPQPTPPALTGLMDTGFEPIHEAHNEDVTVDD